MKIDIDDIGVHFYFDEEDEELYEIFSEYKKIFQDRLLQAKTLYEQTQRELLDLLNAREILYARDDGEYGIVKGFVRRKVIEGKDERVGKIVRSYIEMIKKLDESMYEIRKKILIELHRKLTELIARELHNDYEHNLYT